MPRLVRLPPRPTREAVARAIRDIAARHADYDDQHRAEMGTEPADVLAYLHRRSPVIPPDCRRADAHDALVLNQELRWQEHERERKFLFFVRNAKLSLAEVGQSYGYETRQAMQDYRDTLDDQLARGSGQRDRQVGQATGREARALSRVWRGEQAWLDENAAEVTAALDTLIAQTYRVYADGAAPPTDPDRLDADSAVNSPLGWAADVHRDRLQDQLTTGTWGNTGLLLKDLRGARADVTLAPQHGLPRAVLRVELLRDRCERDRQSAG